VTTPPDLADVGRATALQSGAVEKASDRSAGSEIPTSASIAGQTQGAAPALGAGAAMDAPLSYGQRSAYAVIMLNRAPLAASSNDGKRSLNFTSRQSLNFLNFASMPEPSA